MRTSEELKKELNDLKAQFHAAAEMLGKVIAGEHVASLMTPSHIQVAKPQPQGKKLSPVPKPGAAKAKRPRKSQGEITRWVAGQQERRVPNFVKEKTGLDTKLLIQAKYGPGAVFEKDGPLPPALTSGTNGAQASA